MRQRAEATRLRIIAAASAQTRRARSGFEPLVSVHESARNRCRADLPASQALNLQTADAPPTLEPSTEKSTLQIIEINDAAGAVVHPDWLARAEPVHRQLRPQIPADYAGALARVFAGGGRMVLAVQDGAVLGVTIWRLNAKTVTPLEFYIDDLVTDERQRSTGVGKALLGWCEAHARTLGATLFALDSGTQRQQAHKFYFREGMPIQAFHFVKPL